MSKEKLLVPPFLVQETRETVSATVNVETGMTEFVEKIILTAVDTGLVKSETVEFNSLPTAEVGQWIADATSKSAEITLPDTE